MLCVARRLHDVVFEILKDWSLLASSRHVVPWRRTLKANRVMGALETSSRHEGKVLPSLFFDM